MPFQNLFYMVLHGRRNPNLDVMTGYLTFIYTLVWSTFDIIGSPASFSRSTTRGSTLGLIV